MSDRPMIRPASRDPRAVGTGRTAPEHKPYRYDGYDDGPSPRDIVARLHAEIAAKSPEHAALVAEFEQREAERRHPAPLDRTAGWPPRPAVPPHPAPRQAPGPVPGEAPTSPPELPVLPPPEGTPAPAGGAPTADGAPPAGSTGPVDGAAW